MGRFALSVVVVLLILAFMEQLHADTFTTLDMPGKAWTVPCKISGSGVVGRYNDSLQEYGGGFYFNGTTWTTLNVPGASDTQAFGIDGNSIVGWYINSTGLFHGFLYNGTSWTTLDMPGATGGTYPMDVVGSDIVGEYTLGPGNDLSSDRHGFLYNGTSWTALDMPGAAWTDAVGTDGSSIVGVFQDGTGTDHGFLYNGTLWTTLDMPGATWTGASGINGNNIVGTYSDALGNRHGFLYDGNTWTTIDKPGAANTELNGIQGNRIVGCSYSSPNSSIDGFIYTTPEPSTFALLGVGAIGLAGYGLRRRRQNRAASSVKVRT
jgi:hypothetical protein